ncbi:hypothetical protein [Nonomuraea soli]|uniref:WD40 repeat domain-containing protein n=1 Tax=Nonomuraea soli TaxID=1032476 RepID=A0A7W0CL19_9ACTN|nr:hypothetical protein [Nonomuraea soli]MBA2893100.1 hypothetical protein [Nonomuraea soli]
MRRLLMLCLLLTACTAQPPPPGTAPPDPVRLAYGAGCVDSCSPWTLLRRSGRSERFHEARARPDEEMDAGRAPLAVSADGLTLAYYRDARLTVRHLAGGVVDLGPRPFEFLTLSPDGDGLIGSRESGRIELFDTATGRRLWAVDDSGGVASVNGGRLLLTRLTLLNTTDLVLIDERGSTALVDTPPQAVAANAPFALSPDGTTVATLAAGTGRLRLYNLRTGRITHEVRATVPAKHRVEHLYWSTQEMITARSCRRTEHAVFSIDARTGLTRPVDAYKAPKYAYACEGSEE